MYSNTDIAPMVGYEDYLVSTSGVVSRNGRIKKATVNHRGYECMGLWKKQKRKHFTVHYLVAKTFIENPKGLPQINHIDGDKLNNDASNLEWCDGFTNMQHACLNGLMKTKLSASDAAKVKGRIFMGELLVEIAKDYGVTASNISGIKHGNKWGYVYATPPTKGCGI